MWVVQLTIPQCSLGGRALREAPRAQVEKNVGRASGNPTRCIEGRALREAPHVSHRRIEGRALREAPHVSHRTYAEAVNGVKQVAASGSAQAPVIGTAVPPLPTLGSLGIRMPAGLKLSLIHI